MRNSSSYPYSRGTMYYVRIAVAVLAFVGLCWFCTSQPGSRPQQSGPTRTPRPIPTRTVRPTDVVFSEGQKTATAQALSAHTGAVRIMSYNVQSGGGERIPKLTAVIKAYNPDILAIQEANGWDANESEILTALATELEMESVYCKGDPALTDANGNTEDVVLLSKLPIASSKTHSDISHCVIEAEIQATNGTTVHVITAHIADNYDEVACQNIEKLAGIIQPLAGEQAVLIGDFNLPPPNVVIGFSEEQIACPPILLETGWKYVGAVGDVSQIWVTETTKGTKYAQLPGPTKGIIVPRNDILAASGHLPVGVDFYFP